jgi:hypothetical protein
MSVSNIEAARFDKAVREMQAECDAYEALRDRKWLAFEQWRDTNPHRDVINEAFLKLADIVSADWLWSEAAGVGGRDAALVLSRLGAFGPAIIEGLMNCNRIGGKG